MSIRPIDLQAMLTRSAEISRINSPDASKPEIMHQQFAAQMQKENEQERQQVNMSAKTEQGNVNEDGSNKNDSETKRGRREREKKEAAKAVRDYKSGILDIKV